MGVMLISSLEDFLDIDIWMSSVSTWINMLTWKATVWCKYLKRLNDLSPALLLQSQPAGNPVWCCLWHLLHVQGKLLDIQLKVLSNFFRRMEQLTKFSLGVLEKQAVQWRWESFKLSIQMHCEKRPLIWMWGISPCFPICVKWYFCLQGTSVLSPASPLLLAIIAAWVGFKQKKWGYILFWPTLRWLLTSRMRGFFTASQSYTFSFLAL